MKRRKAADGERPPVPEIFLTHICTAMAVYIREFGGEPWPAFWGIGDARRAWCAANGYTYYELDKIRNERWQAYKASGHTPTTAQVLAHREHLYNELALDLRQHVRPEQPLYGTGRNPADGPFVRGERPRGKVGAS